MPFGQCGCCSAFIERNGFIGLYIECANLQIGRWLKRREAKGVIHVNVKFTESLVFWGSPRGPLTIITSRESSGRFLIETTEFDSWTRKGQHSVQNSKLKGDGPKKCLLYEQPENCYPFRYPSVLRNILKWEASKIFRHSLGQQRHFTRASSMFTRLARIANHHLRGDLLWNTVRCFPSKLTEL